MFWSQNMMLAACTTTTTHPHIRRGWQTGIGCCDRLTFQQFHSIELPPLLPPSPSVSSLLSSSSSSSSLLLSLLALQPLRLHLP